MVEDSFLEKQVKEVSRSETNTTKEIISSLQEKLEREKDMRREDQFIFGLFSIILFDCAIFPIMDTWGGPVSILILQIILLIVIAKKFGMERISETISNIVERLTGLTRNSD